MVKSVHCSREEQGQGCGKIVESLEYIVHKSSREVERQKPDETMSVKK
jgi:hypothetical protein